MTFIDSEKAFDRVPREVVLWALRYLGVDEWIVSVIRQWLRVKYESDGKWERER